MADFNGIIAAPMSSLEKGKNYYLVIKVKIDKVRLPLHMENIFFFVSFWDFETVGIGRIFLINSLFSQEIMN